MKRWKKIFNEYSYNFGAERLVNGIPSNRKIGDRWYDFMNKFNIGIIELDTIASEIGLRDAEELVLSFSPQDMYELYPRKVREVLGSSNIFLKKYFK